MLKTTNQYIYIYNILIIYIIIYIYIYIQMGQTQPCRRITGSPKQQVLFLNSLIHLKKRLKICAFYTNDIHLYIYNDIL